VPSHTAPGEPSPGTNTTGRPLPVTWTSNAVSWGGGVGGAGGTGVSGPGVEEPLHAAANRNANATFFTQRS